MDEDNYDSYRESRERLFALVDQTNRTSRQMMWVGRGNLLLGIGLLIALAAYIASAYLDSIVINCP